MTMNGATKSRAFDRIASIGWPPKSATSALVAPQAGQSIPVASWNGHCQWSTSAATQSAAINGPLTAIRAASRVERLGEGVLLISTASPLWSGTTVAAERVTRPGARCPLR